MALPDGKIVRSSRWTGRVRPAALRFVKGLQLWKRGAVQPRAIAKRTFDRLLLSVASPITLTVARIFFSGANRCQANTASRAGAPKNGRGFRSSRLLCGALNARDYERQKGVKPTRG